ncbi:MAG: AraC family transcriptional regulator [Defluviitaleaceae bacterium]|nr:AraC family transcriptional regulator [Defluviitaleaceae bacterium]
MDYIEENIGDEIKIEALANIAALSLFYYQRLFARLVKKPVREYIKLRRLARSCASLRKNNHITDIAAEYGFGNRETFSRAFKETYGITPSQYKNKPVGLNNFDKPNLLLNYVMVGEGVPLISEGIVLEYNRKTLCAPVHFLGVKDFWHFRPGKMLGERPGVSEPAAIWDKFFEVQKDVPCITNGRRVGVSYHGGAPEGCSTYFVGAEVEAAVVGTAATRFASWQLPAREYIVCEYEAEDFKQLMASMGTMMKFTRVWLKKHGLRADGFFPEIYYNDQSRTHAYMEMWIPFVERENNI